MTDSKNLLILDDEPSIRESLSVFFEDEGYSVYLAENGEKGLEIFFNTAIDVVITDLRMPVKDGFDVMEAIHAVNPDIQIIVISGIGEKHDIIRALQMGAKDYITKPVTDLEIISHSVKRAFENHALNQENIQYRKALEKSEYHYRTITENIAEGVFTVDENQNITYVNQAFCSIIGYAKQDLLLKTLDQISTPDSFQTIRSQSFSPGKGNVKRFEIELVHQSSNRVNIELACSPVFSHNNRYRGLIALVRDITELTKLRDRFKKFLLRSKKSDQDVVPICASCKNIKMTETDWIPIEDHFIDTVFSHGICPDCCKKLYPQFDFSQLDSTDP
ncbi:MAG: response regulator [Desulfobacterales bacterium]|nr:response regulator [Desulfobacterales bacterium]